MVNINEDKLERIKKVLLKSDFQNLDEFVNRAVELLLFAEENKDKFNQLVRSSSLKILKCSSRHVRPKVR